jgi:hypothetical protein
MSVPPRMILENNTNLHSASPSACLMLRFGYTHFSISWLPFGIGAGENDSRNPRPDQDRELAAAQTSRLAKSEMLSVSTQVRRVERD